MSPLQPGLPGLPATLGLHPRFLTPAGAALIAPLSSRAGVRSRAAPPPALGVPVVCLSASVRRGVRCGCLPLQEGPFPSPRLRLPFLPSHHHLTSYCAALQSTGHHHSDLFLLTICLFPMPVSPVVSTVPDTAGTEQMCVFMEGRGLARLWLL